MLRELITDGPLGILLFLLLLLTIVLVVVLLVILAVLFFQLLDSTGTSVQFGQGIIRAKEYIPASTTLILVNNFPHFIYQNEKWILRVQVGNKLTNVIISKEVYNLIPIGTKVSLLYRKGRFTDKIYIKEIKGW